MDYGFHSNDGSRFVLEKLLLVQMGTTFMTDFRLPFLHQGQAKRASDKSLSFAGLSCVFRRLPSLPRTVRYGERAGERKQQPDAKVRRPNHHTISQDANTLLDDYGHL